MRVLHKVGLIIFLAALAMPVAMLDAQGRIPSGRDPFVVSAGNDEGYRQGLLVGQDHGRRGQAFNFGIAVEYRQGDAGYRPEFGSRNRYRVDFRIGFERGYRDGFSQVRVDQGRPDRPAPWWNDRGRVRSSFGRDNGYRDGYSRGLNDGRRRHRDDPFAQGWYRRGDRGYDRRDGFKDDYRANYREGFRSGYERGYRDGLYYR
jgi:hypothetical protein